MEALFLDDQQPDWWERFRRGLPAPQPAAQALWARWSRSRDLGVPAERIPAEEALHRGAALRAHQEQIAPLHRQIAPLFAQTADAAARHDFTLLLADAAGVVTHQGGGGAFAPVAQQLRLIEGASWSEATRGTNAIGTALAEGRPTAVIGGAHYVRGFEGLVCYGAPIRDLDGTVVAVLDASSAVARADATVGALVSAAALAMEAALRAQAWSAASAQTRGLIERTLDRVSGPALLVEAPGRVVRCNPAARLLLGGPGPVEAALGLDWPALRAAALGPGSAGVHIARLAGARARLEPLFAPNGGLLAIAVFVEEPRRSAALRVSRAAPDPFAAVFADDPATRAAVDLARRVAPSDLPIVLLAETGSGKERFAEAIHAASARREGPFVAVNCGSFAPELLAAELFGHGPGAFTGADRAGREGLLHGASGGTLFLDEIADMPPAMQVALLRVLEDGRYCRVGERNPRKAEVRVVCATCRDLPALVAAGTFRQDLWFRLRGLVLRLPPLRLRADRLGLARFLLATATAPAPAPELGASLAAFIEAYDWPGNVRELKSTLAVALVLSEGAPTLEAAHLPPDLALPAPPSVEGALEEVQLQAIERAVEACRGNVSAAARRLGVARSTIYRALGRRG